MFFSRIFEDLWNKEHTRGDNHLARGWRARPPLQGAPPCLVGPWWPSSTYSCTHPLLLPHHSTTPTTIIMDISQASRGHRPTQAKSLSLGEYVFLTDITFMFTHTHCQMSVLILFHCNIHASLFSFSCFLLVCLLNLKKKQKNSSSLFFCCSSNN